MPRSSAQVVAVSRRFSKSAFAYQVLIPGMLSNELSRPASDLALVYAAAAVGGLAITLVLAGTSASSSAWAMHVSGVLLGISIIGLSLVPDVTTTLLAAVAVGAFSSALQLVNNVRMMLLADPAYYARVMSVSLMSFGVMSACAFPIGVLADVAGERFVLFGSGCALLGIVAVGIAWQWNLGVQR